MKAFPCEILKKKLFSYFTFTRYASFPKFIFHMYCMRFYFSVIATWFICSVRAFLSPPPPPPTHDSFIFFANVIFHVLTFCSRCHALNCTFGSWHVRARFLGNVRCKNRIITCEMYVTCSVEFYTGCRNPRSFIEWLNSGIHLSNPKRQWEQ